MEVDKLEEIYKFKMNTLANLIPHNHIYKTKAYPGVPITFAVVKLWADQGFTVISIPKHLLKEAIPKRMRAVNEIYEQFSQVRRNALKEAYIRHI